MSKNDSGVATATLNVCLKQMEFGVQEVINEYLEKQKVNILALVKNELKSTNINELLKDLVTQQVGDMVSTHFRYGRGSGLVRKFVSSKLESEIIKSIKKILK